MDKTVRRKTLLKALKTDRNFLCMAADAYRSPHKRNSFGKWTYQHDLSDEEKSVYLKLTDHRKIYCIAFRGTATRDDVMVNIKLIMRDFFQSSRFKRDFKFVKQFMNNHPKAYVILVGHSLGGRLASEIAKCLKMKGLRAVTFNEVRVFQDVGKADNHHFVKRYRTKSDFASVMGVIGFKSKRTIFHHLPGYGHGIKNMQRMICKRKALPSHSRLTPN